MDVICTANSCGAGVPVYEFLEVGPLKKGWQELHDKGEMQPLIEKRRDTPRSGDVIKDPDHFKAQ